MIIYLGNKLLKSRKTKAVIDTLTELLSKDFNIKSYSSYKNPFLRVIDGLYHLISKTPKIDFVLLDVFSSKNIYYTYALGIICRLLKLRYVLFLHGGNLPQRHQQSSWFLDTLFKKSQAIVTPSGYLYDYFKDYYDGVRVILNTVDANKYMYKTNREYMYPKILYLRGFGKVYNPQMLIKALTNVIKEYPLTKAYLLGQDLDGTLNECKILVEKLGLNKNIDFMGPLSTDDWLSLSNECNIMVSTPNFDNTPISVLEGMMIGLPVISTNVGGMKYLIEDGITGFLVEKDNSNILSKKIISIFNNHKIIHDLVLNARIKVEYNHSWENVRIKWINLFEELRKN
jgi:glycosyltransferase involved in cell wall biosynthesis